MSLFKIRIDRQKFYIRAHNKRGAKSQCKFFFGTNKGLKKCA